MTATPRSSADAERHRRPAISSSPTGQFSLHPRAAPALPALRRRPGLCQLVASSAELPGVRSGVRTWRAGLLAGCLLLQPDGRRNRVYGLGGGIPVVDLALASLGPLSAHHPGFDA